MDRMEKSAHVGLVALAVSDMIFCFFYLFTLVVPLKVVRFGKTYYHFVVGNDITENDLKTTFYEMHF